MKAKLSKIRSAAGKSGAASRWGDQREKATACLRAYPADADFVRDYAKRNKLLPADVISAFIAKIRSSKSSLF